MSVSSSSSERNFSSYGFIHNKLRNRLTDGRANKLVFRFCNLPILDNILSDESNSHLWNNNENISDIDSNYDSDYDSSLLSDTNFDNSFNRSNEFNEEFDNNSDYNSDSSDKSED